MKYKENYYHNENKTEQYLKGEFKCVFLDNLSNHHMDSVKSIIDNFSPYLDHKILVKFKKISPHNPGFHSSLLAKFKSPEDYDNVIINTDFENKSHIPMYLIHEIGHAFSSQIEEVAKNEGLDIYPPGENVEDEYFENYEYNYQNGEFQADFLLAYIMNPDFLKNNSKSDIQKNMIKVYDKLFENNNFEKLRETLHNNDLKYKQEIEEQIKEGKIEKPIWMEKDYENTAIYYRALDKEINKKYNKYYNDLFEKYKSF